MGRVLFTADWHLAHKSIRKYRLGVDSHKENEDNLFGWAERNFHKSDVIWFLGDIFIENGAKGVCTPVYIKDMMCRLADLPGTKILVPGNHDPAVSMDMLNCFDKVQAVGRKYGSWLTHIPNHPQELRGKLNFHGHVHNKTILDPRYYNMSVDYLQHIYGDPCVSLDVIRQEITRRQLGDLSNIVEVPAKL